jgi:hypothetical protein
MSEFWPKTFRAVLVPSSLPGFSHRNVEFIAAVIVFVALADLLISWSGGHPILRLVPFIAAGRWLCVSSLF